MIVKPEGTRCTKFILISLGVIFVIACIIVVTLIAVYYDSYSYPNDYAVVFDAGSSSTKMYIYTWRSGLSASRGDKVTITEIAQCTKSSGLDKITSKDQVILYFNDCLQTASKTVPSDRKSRAYISLAATAGMRLLYASNSTQAETILNYTREHFSKSEFLYKNESQVQIISGKNEGLYAWISANYFLDKFSTKTNPVSTSGILDLGGASTQIAFVPSSSIENASLSQFYGSLRIYGVNYTPYSYSFLCWGVNQISLIYHTYLIIKNNYANVFNASCYHTGTYVNFSRSSILSSNCANGILYDYPVKINISRINQPFYIINGISDPDKCAQEVSDLFPDPTCSYGTDKCSFNNVYMPKLTNENKLIAFTNYYLKITNTEILSNKTLKKDLAEYKIQTKYLCSLDYQTISSINNKTSPPIFDEFLRTTCFFNYYVINLYAKYKIETFDNVEILSTINNYTVGWTLGYLLDQLNRDDFLPYEVPPRKLKSEFFTPAIIIASLFLVFSIVALLVCIFRL